MRLPLKEGFVRPAQNVYLAPFDHATTRAAVDGNWLDDEAANRMVGAGRGIEGKLAAMEGLALLLEPPRGVSALSIKHGHKYAGFVVYEATGQKTVSVHFFVAPESRNSGVGSTAARKLTETMFSRTHKGEVYRIEARPLRINKEAIDWFQHLGFTQEGVLRSAYWMDRNCHDIALMRMLRPEWTRIRRELLED